MRRSLLKDYTSLPLEVTLLLFQIYSMVQVIIIYDGSLDCRRDPNRFILLFEMSYDSADGSPSDGKVNDAIQWLDSIE